jgi:hypothetical protein
MSKSKCESRSAGRHKRGGAPVPVTFDLLYVNWVRPANVKLAYGAVVTMTATPEADQLIWHPTAVAQPRASEIGDDLQAYRDFIADFKSATGSESVATREFENGDGVKSA